MNEHIDRGPGFTHFDSPDCGCQPKQTPSQAVSKSRRKAVAQRNVYRMYLQEMADSGNTMAQTALDKGSKV